MINRVYIFILLIVFTANSCKRSVESKININCKQILPVFNNKKEWGGIDCNGNLLIPFQYDWLYFNRYGTDKILVERDSFKLIINKNNNTVLTKKSNDFDIYILENGIKIFDTDTLSASSIIMTDESTIKCIDSREVISELKQKFYSLGKFNFGLAPSSIEKFGEVKYVDNTGQVVIDDEFLLGSEFQSCGLALVLKEDKWGYINTNGTFIWSSQIKENVKDYFSYRKNGSSKGGNTYESLDKRGIIDFIDCTLSPLFSDLTSQDNIDFSFHRDGCIIW